MCVTREQLYYRDATASTGFAARLGAGLAAMFPGLPFPAATADELRPRWSGPTVEGPSVLIECSADEIPPFARFSTPPYQIAEKPNDRYQRSGHRRGDGRCPAHREIRKEATPIIMDMLRSVYPHDQIFGEYCTVNNYLAARPRSVRISRRHRSLEEWSYSLRGFTTTDEPGLWLAYDRLGKDTEIFTRTVANPGARTVDYHCAWDQGQHLWMIYLMRVVDAQVVFDKPGSVVLWTNCHHPFYDENPYPETAPPERPVWVGDFWDMFWAGHLLEMENLKAISNTATTWTAYQAGLDG